MSHIDAEKTESHRPRSRARFRNGGSLGLKVTRTDEVIRHIERGLSYQALRRFESSSGLSVARVAAVLGIPERTLARRKVVGRLSPEESERLLRLSAVFEKAAELFEGNVPDAVQWLTTPKKALGDSTPLFYSRTEVGAREVENLIGRLEHGVFS
jgi:putative toxin-antitoxin system antitoxin component (TIGR02293 family)